MLFAVTTLLAPLSAQAAESLKGVALVIGNGDYEHLSKLPNPENDANDVEELLNKLGFDTTATSDRDARRLKRDLEGFAEDAEGADVAVLYYSGHGIEAGGQNFLVPVDADISSLDNAGETLVPIDALIDKLKAEVPIVIVMLDACRDNPFPADAVVKLSPDAKPEPIAVAGLGGSRSAVSLNPTAGPDKPADANVGTVLAFAAEPGKVALDGEVGQNSPYAAALLRHLSAMSGDEFGMVMRMVAEEVYLKTSGQQRPWVNESMRRLLYLGKTPDGPTGAEGDILNERRGLLVTIAALPDPQRRTIETIATDSGVPMDALYGMLKALGAEVPSDPKELDALLRGQTEKVKAMMAERDTLKSADPEIIRLSNLADQALAEGALNTAISLRQQAKARAKEVEATVEDAEAQLKQRRIELAEVYAKSAEAYALAFKHREAALDYEEAARQVEKWDEEKAFWHTRSAATAWLEAGKLRGGTSDLKRAVEVGKTAVALGDRLLAADPERKEFWQDTAAQTLNNLANASSSLYVATKDDQLLIGAMQAYERSLKVLTRERGAENWAVVAYNLSGIMMMLGESKTDEVQLQTAIELFEVVLTIWTRDANPQKWAMVMAEMGTTKTILAKQKKDQSLFKQAIADLEDSLRVYSETTTPLDWAVAQASLANAYSNLGMLSKDPEHGRKSIAASQEALKVYTLDRAPRLWARTMHDMAVHIVDNSNKETRTDAWKKALAIYDQVTAAMNADDQLNEYGLSAGNAALTRIDLGDLNSDQALIETAIAALRDLVGAYERNQRPVNAGFYAQEMGAALTRLGKIRARPDEYQQAIDAYEEASRLYREADEVDHVDALRPKLASAFGGLAYQKFRQNDSAGVVEARRAALSYSDRTKNPTGWRFAVVQLGDALQTVGKADAGVDRLREAAELFRLAQSATEIETKREEWAKNQQSLVNTLSTIVGRTNLPADYTALASAYGAQVADKDKARERDGRDAIEANRLWAVSMAAETASNFDLMKQAIAEHHVLLASTDMPDADKIYPASQLLRSLFVGANLGGGDAMRREAVAATDEHWPLIERIGTLERKVVILLDRANLMAAIATTNPAAYSSAEIEAAFQRAIALTDQARDPATWQNAQTQFVTYQLAGMDSPDFPLDRMSSGIATLQKIVDATPKQANPQSWAEMANWYGYALSLRGKRENTTASFEQAVPVLRDALAAFETANNPISAAHTRDSLCGALVGLGRLQKQRALVQEGVDNCASAEAYMRQHQMTSVLPIVEANLADARKALAELTP